MLPCLALPQTPPGSSVAGQVLDPAEAGVAGARVSLLKSDGSAAGETTADANGLFRLSAVAPGNYRLRAEHDGFERSTVPVKVPARITASVTIRLSVATVRSEVSVTAQSTELSTDTAENKNNVTL